MSKTVRISPLLVLVSVLVAASLGDWIGGLFGGFVAALLAIPAAGAFQVIVREAWRLTAPPPAGQAEADAVVEAAGEAAEDAAEVAEEAEDADEQAERRRPGCRAGEGQGPRRSATSHPVASGQPGRTRPAVASRPAGAAD